jgi:hypothetical protein
MPIDLPNKQNECILACLLITMESFMLRKISLALMCAVLTLSTPVYSIMTHMLQKGVTLEFDFPSNEPQIFINYMFWPIEANCKITSEALLKKGKINDVPLSAGQNLRLRIHPGDYIKLNAESGAKVQITNLSDRLVHAICVA